LSQSPPTGSAPDPIGRASARLFAAGVEREQRLVTLRFLGILLETADAEGRVHCDPDDLVGLGLLHGLEAEEVTRSRALLETFDVLDREPTGWAIKHFAPVGDEVPPAEVMAAIGRALAKPERKEVVVQPEPVVVTIESARARRARRWMAAPVAAASAAAVVLIALLVSGQMRVPLVSSPASNGHQTAVGVGNTQPSATGGTASSASSPSSSPSPSAGSATAPSVAQTPAGSAPPGTQSASQEACPVGTVSATIDHMDQQLDTSGPPATTFSVSLPPIARTSVSGVVHNASAAAVMVSPFPVTVNFADPSGHKHQTVTATALTTPTLVAAGASIPWSVTVQNPQSAPVPGTADAAPPTWRWDDAKLAATCPH
jgi:hypothetical protein